MMLTPIQPDTRWESLKNGVTVRVLSAGDHKVHYYLGDRVWDMPEGWFRSHYRPVKEAQA